MFDNNNTENYKMKNLVDISAMVTQSLNFFDIKDKIIEKMLEVVHPTKACVNLFYRNNYEYAYLVCSETLNEIPDLFDIKTSMGIKIDFNEYPKYIHEAVAKKEIIYIENIFEDERAVDERELAKKEGYIGRIVFPLVVNYNVVGFMTCFLTKDDKINEYDIDFISSVSSLISLSIDITMKNNNTHMLVHKLRGAISSINEAIQKLYFNNNINEFLDHLSKQACHITHSKETIIVTEKVENKNKMFSFYGVEGKKQTNIYPIIGKILSQDSIGAYCNENKLNYKEIKNYIYYKIKDSKSVIGYIVCANSPNYTEDDLNILSIFAKQLSVALKLYEYNLVEIKHKILENEPVENGNKLNLFSLKISSNAFSYANLVEELGDILTKYALSRSTYDDLREKEKYNTLVTKAKERLRKAESNEGELGEILLYSMLEAHLKAPKLLTKLELKTDPNHYVNGADGVHLLKIDDNPLVELK